MADSNGGGFLESCWALPRCLDPGLVLLQRGRGVSAPARGGANQALQATVGSSVLLHRGVCVSLRVGAARSLPTAPELSRYAEPTDVAMGLMKWMARRGAVGGTARWAANGYKFFRQRHPDEEEFPDPVIYRLMIATRYQAMPDPQAEQFLLTLSDHLKGLRALVVAILDQEAGFTENTDEVQQMFLTVINEELRKQGLTPQVIHGKS